VRAEIQVLNDAVDRSERLAFVGASGCGKTSVIKELLLARRTVKQRVAIYDPFLDLPGLYCATPDQALRALASSPYARIRTDNEEIYASILRLSLRGGGVLCVADEAQNLAPASGRVTAASADLLHLVRWGRHKGCPFLWASQSPGACSYALIENSTGARVIGNLSASPSLQKIAIWGLDKREVANLSIEKHELMLWIPGGSPVRRFRSVKM